MSSIVPANPVPLPLGDAIAERRTDFRGSSLSDVISYLRSRDSQGFLTQTWQRFLSQQSATIFSSPTRISTDEKRDQNANIAATDISNGSLATGFYRFSWYVTIDVVAGVASSVTVAVTFTDRGLTKTKSYPAITGNTTDTFDHNGGPIRIDANSPVSYSTTYASNPAGVAKYDILAVLERINA